MISSLQVRLTEQAKQDLRGIYEYIAFTLLEPEIAKKLKSEITAVFILSQKKKYTLSVFYMEGATSVLF
ncbi:MAG: type II toxin-antitoxin system RelE/ParE family toxin [Treponema sp.]|jgi:plasmid stabilization system protein ParE|nr:type II toxin-antitoxin system RelE/ParE family toxin [Treponema sp.]